MERSAYYYYRRLKQLSQEEVAERAQIARETYNRIENRRQEPHPWIRRRISDVLEIPPQELITPADIPTEPTEA